MRDQLVPQDDVFSSQVLDLALLLLHSLRQIVRLTDLSLCLLVLALASTYDAGHIVLSLLLLLSLLACLLHQFAHPNFENFIFLFEFGKFGGLFILSSNFGRSLLLEERESINHKFFPLFLLL